MDNEKPRNVFQSMIDPRGFIRSVLGGRSRANWYMAYLVGIVWVFDRALHFQLGFSMSALVIVLFALITGLAIGYTYLYITSWLLYQTGKIFKGQAKFPAVLQAFVWSRIPELFVMLSWFCLIALLQNGAFTSVLIDSRLPFIIPSLIWVQLIFGFWSFVLLFHTLGEVQGFSAWIAIWNVLFTFIIWGIIYQLGIYLFASSVGIQPVAVKELVFMGKYLT